MNNDKDKSNNIERKVQQFFQKQMESLKASKDLWSKLKPRLEENLKDGELNNSKRRFRRWLVGPRLIAISVSVSLVLIMIIASAVWLTANHSTSSINTTSDLAAASGGRASVPLLVTPTFAPPATTITQTSLVITSPPTTVAAITPVAPEPMIIATTTSATSGSGSGSSNFSDLDNDVLDTVGKQVISQASVSLEVTTVSTALSQVETMAQNLGGSVDSMSSSGEQNQEQATVTIRVPQNQFLAALNQLQSMGTVQSQNITSQDVTQQYIDLQAQLNSAQLEEQSLQAILAKATTVSDEIAIQEQLTEVIAQAESLQGQINYIQNQVSMSTITVTLNTPATTDWYDRLP
jgi:hypothetical protein